ncbi:MAG: hypothetical protein U0835_15375 [Isosphaeraceae bacterium]
MSRVPSRSGGAWLTARRVLILGLYLALLFGSVIPFLKRIYEPGWAGALLTGVLCSPPLLAMLVVLLDEPGPAKNWAVFLLMALIYPAIALNHDAAVLIDFVSRGQTPMLWGTLLINLAFLPAPVFVLADLAPRTCPNCGKRRLIPLLRLLKRDPRTSNTRWCSSCGGVYWRDRTGGWRVERRKTWLDSAPEAPTPAATPDGVRTTADPPSVPRGPTPRRAGGIAAEERPSSC